MNVRGRLFRIFKEHPLSVGETYSEHFSTALSFASAMIIGAGACIVHAFVPALCKRSASSVIERLHDRMIVSRAKACNDRQNPS